MTDFPQWAKDLRRYDVIAFGIFPFCIFFVNVSTDLIRWNQMNGMDWGGREYAPWPIKTAPAYERTTDEHFQNIMMAAGLSLSIALVDLLIVKLRDLRERRRLESLPAGSFTIERTSLSAPQTQPDDEISGEDIDIHEHDANINSSSGD